MKLTVKISIVEEQLETIQAKRTGEITKLKNLKRKLKQLKQKQTLIKMKNQKQIAKEIINRNDWTEMNIRVSKEHLERIHGISEAMEISLTEALTFLLYSYMRDVDLQARIEASKINN